MFCVNQSQRITESQQRGNQSKSYQRVSIIDRTMEPTITEAKSQSDWLHKGDLSFDTNEGSGNKLCSVCCSAE